MRTATYRTARIETDGSDRPWLLPTIQIGIGFALYMLWALFFSGTDVAMTGIVVMVIAVVQTVLLLGTAYLYVALFGINFGELWVGLLRLGAAAVLRGAVGTLVPVPLVSSIVFLIIIVSTMDLSFGEAVIFTAAYWVVSFVAAVAVVAALS